MSATVGAPAPVRRRHLPWAALGIVAASVLIATMAGLIAPHDPEAIDPINAELPPVFLDGGAWTYPLGTDRLGRDVLSRILFGARLSLGVAAVALLIGGLVGTVLGVVAGYRGGWVDALIMRLADTFLAFPSILIALVLAVTVGPSFWVVAIVLGLVLWARFARLVRGEVLSWKVRDFIALARVAGARGPYIAIHHLLPNVVNSLVVLCTLQVGWAIVVEASAAGADLGRDGGRGLGLHRDRLVDLGHARRGDPSRRLRVQRRRRLAARPSRSTAAGGVTG